MQTAKILDQNWLKYGGHLLQPLFKKTLHVTVKKPKNLDTPKNTIIILKFEQKGCITE